MSTAVADIFSSASTTCASPVARSVSGDGPRLLLPGEIRLSELIGALSVALDITEGQPAGHAARSCLIGMRVARTLGLAEADLGPLFYALLLKDLGCSSNAAKMAWLFGADDRVVKRDLKEIDWTKATRCFQFTLSHVAPGASSLQKVLQMATLARSGEKGARQLVVTRCERGADIARQLGFPQQTAEAILSLDEHWNGKGHPHGLRGEAIPLFSRIMGLAQTAEVFLTLGGPQHALEVAALRSGTWFDPAIARAFLSLEEDGDFWTSLQTEDFTPALLAIEPPDSVQTVDEEGLDRIAEAFARVVDAKSPWTHRHSEGVAEIATGISHELGFTAIQRRDIRRAGLLHDLGKLGVSSMILDKPGKPTDEEFAEIRRHPDYSKKILDRVPLLRPLSDVASAHHERPDGRGYHRRMPGEAIPKEAMILTAADVFEALSAKRPYRDELPVDKVFDIMKKDLGTGIDPDCYEALRSWKEKTTITPRVERQLEAIERLHSPGNLA